MSAMVASGTTPPLEVAASIREASTSLAAGMITRSQAEQAALEAVGSGRVTWSGPENDRGAAWEVEITLPNGREIDVLVAPDGSIIR